MGRARAGYPCLKSTRAAQVMGRCGLPRTSLVVMPFARTWHQFGSIWHSDLWAGSSPNCLLLILVHQALAQGKSVQDREASSTQLHLTVRSDRPDGCVCRTRTWSQRMTPKFRILFAETKFSDREVVLPFILELSCNWVASERIISRAFALFRSKITWISSSRRILVFLAR